MMASVLLIVPGYPSPTNRYNNVFVHTRVIAYANQGINVKVFSVEKRRAEYTLDGINVIVGPVSSLVKHLKANTYPTILMHFAIFPITSALLRLKLTSPVVVWVHGYEALHWKRRLFFFEPKTFILLVGYMVVNTLQRRAFKHFIHRYPGSMRLVFVSQWMKNVCVEDTGIDPDRIQSVIIPNIIDTDRFEYNPKPAHQRLNVLSIRPYANRKYANDLAVAAVVKLSQTPQFNDFTFAFYGDGRLFKSTTAPLKQFSNVKVVRGFVNHEAMAKLHHEHGVMLIPTRQDAQGVSMGEAMSSGLVPISSLNTAIPEFLDESCGFLTRSVDEMVEALLALHDDAARFSELSAAAAARVRRQCNKSTIVEAELKAILDWSPS
jgi:L-malate glycosyltransferase